MGTTASSNTDILASLPILASILGRKFGVTITFGGKDAWTDGSRINIPALPVDADKELLLLIRGYIDHEAGHVRETDFSLLHTEQLTKLEHTISNVIEDWRIEKKMGEVFPGCRLNLDWLRRHLFAAKDMAKYVHGIRQSGATVSSIISWLHFTIMAWAIPHLEQPRDDLEVEIEKTFPGLPPRLHPLMRELPAVCNSTLNVIDTAKAIAALLKAYAYEDCNKPSDGEECEGQPEGSSSSPSSSDATGQGSDGQGNDGQPASTTQPCEEDTGNQSTGTAQPEASPSSPPPSDAAEKRSDGQGNDGQPASTTQPCKEDTGNQSTGTAQPCAEGTAGIRDNTPGKGNKNNQPDEQALQELRDALAGKNVVHATSIDVQIQARLRERCRNGLVQAAVETQVCHAPLSGADIRQTKKITNTLASKLRAILQGKNTVRGFVGRRGRLQPQLLHRALVGNPSLFLQYTEKLQLKAAVHILLDTSSSMAREPVRLACNAAYALAAALHSLPGISVGASVFPAESGADISRSSVAPILRHGERLHSHFAVNASGGTPLAESLWWLLPVMAHQKEDRKIVLVITDGGVDVGAVQLALEAFRKNRIAVYGIGIQCDEIKKILPETSTVIQSINELASAMFQTTLRAFCN